MAGLRFVKENIRLTNENSALRKEVARLQSELAAANDIIAGRDTAPTDEEFAAHEEAGGGWLVSHEDGVYAGIEPLKDLDEDLCIYWWPLNSSGEPCAWPVAKKEVVT